MKKLITDFEMVITGILLGLFIFMASPMMLPKSNVISISSTKLINAVTFEISRNQVNYSKTEAVHTDAAPIIPA